MKVWDVFSTEDADQTLGSLIFGFDGTVYAALNGARSTLVHNATSHVFVLTLPSGTALVSTDFGAAVAPGGFLSQTTASGNAIRIVAYMGGGLIAEVQRDGESHE